MVVQQPKLGFSGFVRIWCGGGPWVVFVRWGTPVNSPKNLRIFIWLNENTYQRNSLSRGERKAV